MITSCFRGVFAVLLFALLIPGCGTTGFDVWFEDSLIKLFPDATPPGSYPDAPVVWIARNGHASLQLAVRAHRAVTGFRLHVSPPVLNNRVLDEVTVRRVGFVPVRKNTADSPPEELIRTAPAEFPDPLEPRLPDTLEPGRTEVFWLTFRAPGDAQPGDYRGEVAVEAEGRVREVLSFDLKVSEAVVPPQTLKITNWFNVDDAHLAAYYPIEGDREAYWKVLANLARTMSDYRQNVILTPVASLVRVEPDRNGFRFDFSDFDRWIATFEEAGVIGTIEGGHLLTRPTGYYSPIVVPAYVREGSQAVPKMLEPFDKRADLYLAQFLDSLNAHLAERGWKEKYIQHLHDEPHGDEIPVYEHYGALLRRHLPGIPIIDAVDLKEDTGFLERYLDIWVPVLSSFDDRFEMLAGHRAAGGQTWYYTCIVPSGRYLNRFLDYSLLKVRLLHWFNFRHDLSGYLHWGGNYWSSEPFRDVEPVINDGQTLLPPGDNALVYPDPENLSFLSSIRLEQMREGIEDYELLVALAARNSSRAQELVRLAVPQVNDYVRDPAGFRELHTMLLEAAGTP